MPDRRFATAASRAPGAGPGVAVCCQDRASPDPARSPEVSQCAANSGLRARAALALGEDLSVDRDRKRDVAADEDRVEHVSLVAPDLVVAQHAIAAQVRDQHRRSLSLKRRPAVGAVEADHAGETRVMLVLRSYLQIVDEMPRGGVAALPPPGVERADLVVSPELVVADREQAVAQVKLVSLGSRIEIHVMPVIRLQAVERVPQRRFVAIRHGDIASVACGTMRLRIPSHLEQRSFARGSTSHAAGRATTSWGRSDRPQHQPRLRVLARAARGRAGARFGLGFTRRFAARGGERLSCDAGLTSWLSPTTRSCGSRALLI